MLELYPYIKLVHVGTVFASGTLFLVRGLAVQIGQRWAMAPPVRYLSYAIDIVLLAAALMLVSILPAAAFANGWLWAKLSLLVLYIGLGSFALKRGRTAIIRAGCFAAALFLFACVYMIARAHDPLAPLRPWL